MGNVSPLEFLWILVNTVTLAYVVIALSDARADRETVRLMNGKARELAAEGNVRREILRIVKVLLLMGVAIPGLFFADGEVRPDIFRVLPVVDLMALALLLLFQSYIDARDRKRLIVLVTAEALVSKTDSLTRIEAKVDHGTEVAQQAYDAANHVKERFDEVHDRITVQGETMDADRARNATSADTIESTASEVHDLHEGTAPEGAK